MKPKFSRIRSLWGKKPPYHVNDAKVEEVGPVQRIGPPTPELLSERDEKISSLGGTRKIILRLAQLPSRVSQGTGTGVAWGVFTPPFTEPESKHGRRKSNPDAILEVATLLQEMNMQKEYAEFSAVRTPEEQPDI